MPSESRRALQPAPLLETLRSEWKTIVTGAFAPLASFAMFHMVTVYPLSWVFLFTDETPARFLMIEAIAGTGLADLLAGGIVGVASDINVRSLGETPRDVVYLPYTQSDGLPMFTGLVESLAAA